MPSIPPRWSSTNVHSGNGPRQGGELGDLGVVEPRVERQVVGGQAPHAFPVRRLGHQAWCRAGVGAADARVGVEGGRVTDAAEAAATSLYVGFEHLVDGVAQREVGEARRSRGSRRRGRQRCLRPRRRPPLSRRPGGGARGPRRGTPTGIRRTPSPPRCARPRCRGGGRRGGSGSSPRGPRGGGEGPRSGGPGRGRPRCGGPASRRARCTWPRACQSASWKRLATRRRKTPAARAMRAKKTVSPDWRPVTGKPPLLRRGAVLRARR